MGMEALLDTFLAHARVERGLSRNTVEAYARDLGGFAEFLKSQSIDDFEAVDLEREVAFPVLPRPDSGDGLTRTLPLHEKQPLGNGGYVVAKLLFEQVVVYLEERFRVAHDVGPQRGLALAAQGPDAIPGGQGNLRNVPQVWANHSDAGIVRTH